MVSKSTRNYLLIVGIVSEDGSMDGNDLRDYAQSNLEKVVARVPGVGEVITFGSQYAMRIWLNPERLTEYQMAVEDVILALRAYNVEVSAGQFGGTPTVEGQRLNASVSSEPPDPEEFSAIPSRKPTAPSCGSRTWDGLLGTSLRCAGVYKGEPTAALAIRRPEPTP
jgi:HAE1 family hydrophobic/amphiphilic exporter-1